MSETLKSIIDSYRSGLLSTTKIEVFEKKLSDKTIKFPIELITTITFDCSTFQNSDLINMEFINVNFDSSYFEKCLVGNTIIQAVEFENCVLKNCFIIATPFYFPNIFQIKLTKDQLKVRFKFIQVFSSVNIEKVFLIHEFLNSYSSVISNQRKNNIKKDFIQLVHLFKE